VLGKCLGGPNVHVKALICELSVEVVEVVAGGPGSHRVGAAILTMWQLFHVFHVIKKSSHHKKPANQKARTYAPTGSSLMLILAIAQQLTALHCLWIKFTISSLLNPIIPSQ